MTGVSLGGMHTWLAAAADERVAVAAPMIGVQFFGCDEGGAAAPC
jgi:PhoPQ-activated pathogenicity-related protein